MSFRILVTDRFDLAALAMLQGESATEVGTSTTPEPSDDELKDKQGLIIRSRTRVTAELLERAPRLEAIVTATSGFDHIDFEATKKRGITVMYTPDANSASACELTWALTLACTRRLLDAHRAVKAGDWKRVPLIGTQLAGKTYGIVGLGRIGTRVANVARALGMKLVAFDPYQDAFASDIARVSFEELLKLSDVVSFHVPKTDETRLMLGAHHLEEMNRQSILVNTSRGTIVSERDLVLALENGWIAALGLDVFEREPLARDSKLVRFSNVVLSPHLGATTTEAFAAASRDAARKLIAYAKSRAASDVLPPNEPWFHSGFKVRPKGD